VPTDPTRSLYFIDVLRRSCTGAPNQVVVGCSTRCSPRTACKCDLDADLQAPPIAHGAAVVARRRAAPTST
jgi:hypothetical protein